MAAISKTALKAAIDAAITTNGTNAITGAALNAILDTIVDSYEDNIPQLTEAQINALSPALNDIVYNTDRNFMMQYNGTIWATLVAMFIGTTAQINASTPKAGQLFYNTDLNTLSFGDGVTHVGVQTDDCTCVQTVKVSLSSAQILNSFTTPVELIAAPGAGKVINPLSVLVSATYNTTQYATNTSGRIILNDKVIADLDLTFAASGQYVTSVVIESDIVYDIINQPITFDTQTGNPTAGDGTIDIHITYTVITL